MRDQIAELLTQLRDVKFVGGLRKWYDEVSNYAFVFYNEGDGTDSSFTQGDWYSSLLQATNLFGRLDHFDKILKSLPRPHVVSSAELWRMFWVYLEKAEGVISDFDEVYEHFIDHVKYQIFGERTSPLFQICGLAESHRKVDRKTTEAFFSSGFSLGKIFAEAEMLGKPVDSEAVSDITKSLGKAHEPEPDSDRQVGMRLANGVEILPLNDDRLLKVYIRWTCTRDALNDVAAEIVPTLKSAIRTAAILSPSATAYDICPSISFPDLKDHLAFVGFCVSSLWLPPKADTLDKRLANAVRLLREADNQSEDAVSLALSVTALEAILGREEKGISLSKILSSNIATLMENDPLSRAPATAYFKKLYKIRSHALHGVTLDGDPAARGEARLLAGGVLKAVWEHRTFSTGVSQFDHFLDMLGERTRQEKEGLPDGVLDSPVRAIWRKV